MQPAEALWLVADAFEALNIMYCVGGSFASSAYGEPRATRDADILVALPAHHVPALVAQLEAAFFVQPDALYDAITLAPTLRDDPLHRATVNLVHRASFFRIDLFVASGRPFEQAQFARRIAQTIAINPERQAYFVSPEDIILLKLEWYRLSQGILDRQWSDVRAVITTQGDTLDVAYLRTWAAQLAVGDILEAALRGEPPPRFSPDTDGPHQARIDF